MGEVKDIAEARDNFRLMQCARPPKRCWDCERRIKWELGRCYECFQADPYGKRIYRVRREKRTD